MSDVQMISAKHLNSQMENYGVCHLSIVSAQIKLAEFGLSVPNIFGLDTMMQNLISTLYGQIIVESQIVRGEDVKNATETKLIMEKQLKEQLKDIAEIRESLVKGFKEEKDKADKGLH